MTIPPLTLQDVYYRYDDGTWGLQGLDLTIRSGIRLAILGANGSGKSTLLGHLNGTLQPLKGEILLDGGPVDHNRPFLRKWRRRVGLVLQNPEHQLFAGTVFQDISFGPLNLGCSERETEIRVAQVMAALDIDLLVHRPIHLLSFGEKKRVAIAGILAMGPELLVLDEPTAGLDPQAAGRLRHTLERLACAGRTLVFSTHDADLALAWADEVALIRQGRVLAHGEASMVLTDLPLLAKAGLVMPTALQTFIYLQQAGWIRAEAGQGSCLPQLAALIREQVGKGA